jgi:large subunit ribosomal protein L3
VKAILGRKVGMTQIFDEHGEAVPVTVIQAGPCYVTQVKKLERDGYDAVQLGFEEVKPQRLSGGFAGVVKRYGFGGGPKTHGQSDRQRAPGSIGATTTPGRVWKGKRMPGRMGGVRVTAQNLRVELVDPERNLLAVRGGVPGARGGLLMVTQARKSRELARRRGE